MTTLTIGDVEHTPEIVSIIFDQISRKQYPKNDKGFERITDPDDFEFLLDVVRYLQHDASSIDPIMVEGFYLKRELVSNIPRRCFWYNEHDWSSGELIETMKRFNGKSILYEPRPECDKQSQVRNKLRQWVFKDLHNRKFEHFQAGEGKDMYCPLSHRKLFWSNCHIDHFEPEFRDMVADFLAVHNLTFDSIDLNDEFLRGEWEIYHADNANVRLVTAEANMRKYAQQTGKKLPQFLDRLPEENNNEGMPKPKTERNNGKRAPNAWNLHCHSFAEQHGIGFYDAVKNAECQASYHK